MKFTIDTVATVAENFTNWIKSVFGFSSIEEKINQMAEEIKTSVEQDAAISKEKVDSAIFEAVESSTDAVTSLIKGKYSDEEVAIIKTSIAVGGIDAVDFIALGNDLNRDPKLVKAKAKKLV